MIYAKAVVRSCKSVQPFSRNVADKEISIAASRGFSELTLNLIRSSHGQSTPSLKISCKSVQPFRQNTKRHSRQTDRRHTVPKARPIVRSAKNRLIFGKVKAYKNGANFLGHRVFPWMRILSEIGITLAEARIFAYDRQKWKISIRELLLRAPASPNGESKDDSWWWIDDAIMQMQT